MDKSTNQLFIKIRNLIIESQSQLAKSILSSNPEFATYQDTNGTTLLHFCATTKNIDCAQLLIDSGANPYALDNSGQPPIRWAMESENEHFLDFYISNNLIVKEIIPFNYPTRSPLCFAIQCAKPTFVQKCLLLGFQGSPLSQIHDAPFVELARLSRKNQWGYTTSQITTNQRIELISKISTLLQNAGINPFSVDALGNSAFFWAAHFENIPLLNWFKSIGQPILPKNIYNETPFFMAVKERKNITINWYLEQPDLSIDILLENNLGQNVIKIATEQKQYKLVSLLEKYFFNNQLQNKSINSKKQILSTL